MWYGPELHLLVTDPEQVRIVLNAAQCFDRPSMYQFIEPLSGHGLITMQGEWSSVQYIMSSGLGQLSYVILPMQAANGWYVARA